MRSALRAVIDAVWTFNDSNKAVILKNGGSAMNTELSTTERIEDLMFWGVNDERSDWILRMSR